MHYVLNTVTVYPLFKSLFVHITSHVQSYKRAIGEVSITAFVRCAMLSVHA